MVAFFFSFFFSSPSVPCHFFLSFLGCAAMIERYLRISFLDEIWKQQATVAAQRKPFLRPSEISRLFRLSCWPLTWFTKAHTFSPFVRSCLVSRDCHEMACTTTRRWSSPVHPFSPPLFPCAYPMDGGEGDRQRRTTSEEEGGEVLGMEVRYLGTVSNTLLCRRDPATRERHVNKPRNHSPTSLLLQHCCGSRCGDDLLDNVVLDPRRLSLCGKCRPSAHCNCNCIRVD